MWELYGKCLTHYQMTNFRLFLIERICSDNFKFDENSKKVSKRIENTVGKGEIARHEQFLLFPQCFQKACFPGASKGVIMWEWVKDLHIKVPHLKPFPNMPLFLCIYSISPLKTVWKKDQLLISPFSTVFSTLL